MSTFRIKQNDKFPEYQTTLIDENGVVDLSNATSLKLILQKRGTTDPAIVLTASIVDAVKGIVKYTWTGTDTATVGFYNAEWEVTFTGGEKMTFPGEGYDIVEIYPELA